MNQLLTYIIADDDELYRELTLHYLQQLPFTECLAVCENAFSTLEQLQLHTPHLLVLDVEMPGLSGIQLVKSLKELPMIIFISSHPSYAVDAFDVDAIDFLVKPVAQERLMRSIEKARALLAMKESTPAADAFEVRPDDSFFVRDKNKYIRIAYADVLYIESLGDFVTIFQQNGHKQVALVSMKNLEQQLPASHFLRISRTHMINTQKITAIDSENIFIHTIQLRIGKTFAENVMQTVVGSNAIKRFI